MERYNQASPTQTSSFTYQYKAHAKQLQSVKQGADSVYQLAYDAGVRTVQRKHGGQVQTFRYDASNLVEEIRTGNDVLRTAYVYDEHCLMVAKRSCYETGIMVKTDLYSYEP